MPNSPDIFRGLEKFHYATTIDLNMGYYSIPLSTESKQLCTIILPWGLYQYTQGIKPATDIFQAQMGALFFVIIIVRVNMDYIILFGYYSFDAHLADVTERLIRLLKAGMQVNPAKCMWFQTTITYLGLLITREESKPQPEKAQGILNIQRPHTQEIHRFVRMVNFYHNLYPKRAETLAPLTELCGQKMKFKWTDSQEQGFQKKKQIVAENPMLTYPQFGKPFLVHTDASEKQIGGVVTQDDKPLGFFSRKLTDTQ
jgi:hypothetical protein